MLNELVGISGKPVPVVERAVEGIQRIMDVAVQRIPGGKPEENAGGEKLKKARGEVLYNYSRDELIDWSLN